MNLTHGVVSVKLAVLRFAKFEHFSLNKYNNTEISLQELTPPFNETVGSIESSVRVCRV